MLVAAVCRVASNVRLRGGSVWPAGKQPRRSGLTPARGYSFIDARQLSRAQFFKCYYCAPEHARGDLTHFVARTSRLDRFDADGVENLLRPVAVTRRLQG